MTESTKKHRRARFNFPVSLERIPALERAPWYKTARMPFECHEIKTNNTTVFITQYLN